MVLQVQNVIVVVKIYLQDVYLLITTTSESAHIEEDEHV